MGVLTTLSGWEIKNVAGDKTKIKGAPDARLLFLSG
jgi:hypothetical protein